MELNAKKTNEVWISFNRPNNLPCNLHMNDVRLELVDKFKLLGVEVQDTLKLNIQVKIIVKKANKRIYHVRAGRRAGIPSEVGPTTYLPY